MRYDDVFIDIWIPGLDARSNVPSSYLQNHFSPHLDVLMDIHVWKFDVNILILKWWLWFIISSARLNTRCGNQRREAQLTWTYVMLLWCSYDDSDPGPCGPWDQVSCDSQSAFYGITQSSITASQSYNHGWFFLNASNLFLKALILGADIACSCRLFQS